MEVQDADRFACSSKDLITSVASKLKFYVEVQRREDGFDTSPSYIPRRAFPKLLPRPMLMKSPQDVSLRHHFTHAQIRCALGKIQSYKRPSDTQGQIERGKKIEYSLKKIFDAISIDHPMWNANNSFNVLLADKRPQTAPTYNIKKNVKALRSAPTTIRRAPPPSIMREEKKRLVNASWKLLLDSEMETCRPKRKYIEMGNTKLQSLDSPRPLQRQYIASIHKKYAAISPRIEMDSFAKSLAKSKFVYDQNGRRHKVMLIKQRETESDRS